MKTKKSIYAFPDGSSLYAKGASVGDGGWGFCITDDPKSKRILHADGGFGELTTNNRMELSGFLNSLIHIYNNFTEINHINIYSDSKYVVEAIYFEWVYDWERNGFMKGSKPVPNADLWKDILTMLRNLKRRRIGIQVAWIKGHNGHFFNETADKIAKACRVSKKKNELYRH